MPRVRFWSHSETTDQPADDTAVYGQPAGSGPVPGQRDAQDGTSYPESAEYSRPESAEYSRPESAEYSRPESAEYSRGEGRGAAGMGYPPTQAESRQAESRRADYRQAEYGQAEGRRAGTDAYGEPAESRRRGVRRRRYFGMAGTLMVLAGLLTFFIGIVALIRGIFFNRVATYPFYYSVRSRGITFVVIGAVAFVVGLALLLHLYWARNVATVVAVVSAVANFMFLPFYPFWSVVVLALNIIIIWELMHEHDRREELPQERGRRELAH